MDIFELGAHDGIIPVFYHKWQSLVDWLVKILEVLANRRVAKGVPLRLG
jgi:hypothetical protein